MSKQIEIRILSDGSIQAETKNIKGKQCLKYIALLESMLEARTVDSHFTQEYYEEEEFSVISDLEVLKNGQ